MRLKYFFTCYYNQFITMAAYITIKQEIDTNEVIGEPVVVKLEKYLKTDFDGIKAEQLALATTTGSDVGDYDLRVKSDEHLIALKTCQNTDNIKLEKIDGSAHAEQSITIGPKPPKRELLPLLIIKKGEDKNKCNKTFRNVLHKSHLKIHTAGKPYSCKKKTSSNDLASPHLRVHTGNTLYLRDECTKSNKSFAKKKCTKEGNTPYLRDECTKLNKSFAKKKCTKEGNTHYLRDECSKLNKSFTKKKYTKHFYSCNQCDNRFAQSCSLLAHMKIHTEAKLYACHECGKGFSHINTLYTHIKMHKSVKQEPNIGDKPYSLRDECNKLNKNLVKNTYTKHYSCNQCDNIFAKRCNLLAHMKIHAGEKLHACHECGKGFSHIDKLNTHIKMHTRVKQEPIIGDKPYSCDRCNESFIICADLIVHMKTHTGEKLYFCKQCNKSFSQCSNLVEHLKKITQ